MKRSLRYLDIAWLSSHDGPGHRVVLYLHGCHLRCPWCHSPHSQTQALLFFPARCTGCGACGEACPEGVHRLQEGVHALERERCVACGRCVEACPVSRRHSLGGALALPAREASVDEMWGWLAPQLEVLQTIGGLTVGGGEALLQADALADLLRRCRQAGVHTAVETSGTLPREAFERVAPWVDCWLFGLRPTPAYVPPHAERIAGNLAYVASTGARVIVRTPLMAGLTDTPQALAHIARLMEQNGLTEIELLPFNRSTPHFYHALGRTCSVGEEANMAPGRLKEVREYFEKRRMKATLLT